MLHSRSILTSVSLVWCAVSAHRHPTQVGTVTVPSRPGRCPPVTAGTFVVVLAIGVLEDAPILLAA